MVNPEIIAYAMQLRQAQVRAKDRDDYLIPNRFNLLLFLADEQAHSYEELRHLIGVYNPSSFSQTIMPLQKRKYITIKRTKLKGSARITQSGKDLVDYAFSEK